MNGSKLIVVLLLIISIAILGYRNYQESVAFNVVYVDDVGTYEDRVALAFFAPSTQRFEFNEHILLEISYTPGITPSLVSELIHIDGDKQTVIHRSVRNMTTFDEVLFEVNKDLTVVYRSPV